MTLSWPWPILRQGHIWYFGFSIGKNKNCGFFWNYYTCDLKVGRCRQFIELMKVWKVKVISWKILFSRTGRLISMKARPRYQVSVCRTNGPLVTFTCPTIILTSHDITWDDLVIELGDNCIEICHLGRYNRWIYGWKFCFTATHQQSRKT